MTPADEAGRRGRGRPATKPAGAKARAWWCTDAEYAATAARAARTGLSVQEFVRRRALFLSVGKAKRG